MSRTDTADSADTALIRQDSASPPKAPALQKQQLDPVLRRTRRTRRGNAGGVGLAALALTLAACAATPAAPPPQAAAPVPAPAAPTTYTVAEDARLMAFLDAAFDAQLAQSPQGLTGLGSKERYSELNDYTPAAQARSLALAERQLAEMKRSFDPRRLSESGRLSYQLFEYEVEEERRADRWRDYGFIFTANGSPAGSLPVFLINNHRVDTVSDAEAYVSRLREVDRVGREIAANFESRAAKGITPPAFVFEPAIADARKVITGAPFAAGPDSAVWADFQA